MNLIQLTLRNYSALLKCCEIKLTDKFNPVNVKKLLNFINKSQND